MASPVDPNKPPKPKVYKIGTGGTVKKAVPTSDKKYQVGTGKATGFDKFVGDTISIGESFINTISMPLYNEIGRRQERVRQESLSPEEYKKEFGTYPISYYKDKPQLFKQLGLGYFAKSEALARQKQEAAANKNATAWQRGERVQTGEDIVTSEAAQKSPTKSLFETLIGKQEKGTPGAFWSGLAIDIARDPINFVPAGVVLRPAKAVLSFGKTALKQAKAAATLGEISVAPAAREASTRALKAGATKEEAKAAADKVKAAGTVLKPGYSPLAQYTRKPIIKQNLKRETGLMGAKLSQIEKTIEKNFTYKTTQLPDGTRAKLSEIIGSSLEAGYKAAGSTLTQIYGRQALRKLSTIDAKIAKKELKAAKKAGTVEDIATAAAPAGIEAARILDNEVALPEPTAVVDEVPAPKPSDVQLKKAEKLVTTVEKLSKGTKGLALEGNNVRKTVTDILKKEADVSNFAKSLRSDTINRLKAIVDEDINPFTAIKAFVQSGDQQLIDLAKLIVKKSIPGTSGQVLTIEQMFQRGIGYETLSRKTQKKILEQFAAFLSPGKLKLSELNTILDSKTVTAIEKTGAVDPNRETNVTALQKILAGLSDGTQQVEKTYENFADLVGGLKAGDQIDYNILEKLLKAIDPDAIPLQQVSKALDKKTTYEMMRNIIIGEGVQTVYAARRRIELTDADALMKADGLSQAEMIASYTTARLAREILKSELTADAMRADAAENVYTYWNTLGKTREKFEEVLYGINAGFSGTTGKNAQGGQFDYLREMIEAGTPTEDISVFNDLVVKSEDLERAILPDQFNQSVEARILANIFGIARRHQKKTVTNQKTGKQTVTYKTEEEILDDLIERTDMLDDAILAIFGGRIAHQKFALRGVPAEGQTKHFVFNTIGDFMRIVRDAGRPDLVHRALIPNIRKAGIQKTDALSFISVGEAIRYIAEMTERNVEPVKAEIIARLKGRHESEPVWSPTYRKQVDKFVGDLADILATPDVVTAFKAAHSKRAMAAVEDALDSAESITDDQFRTMYNGFIVNIDEGIDSSAARAQLAREWFNKFIYASNVFRLQKGEVAAVVYQAAALAFMKEGRVMGGASLIGRPSARDAAEREMFEESIRLIEEMYKYSAAEKLSHPGREMVKPPTEAQKAAALDNLTGAEDAYKTHIDTITAQTTPEQIKTWMATHNKNQTKLDKARTAAAEVGIPTRNYVDGQWIPSAHYNRQMVLDSLKAENKGLIVTSQGIIDVTDALADTPLKPVKIYKMTAAQHKLFMERWTRQAVQESLDAGEGTRREIAQEVLNLLSDYDKIGLTDAHLGLRLIADQHQRVFEDSDILIVRGPVDSAAAKSTGKTEPGEIKLSRIDRLAEHFNPEYNKWDLRSMVAGGETRLVQSISKISDYASQMQREYETLFRQRPELADQAISHALSRVPLPDNAEAIVVKLMKDIRAIIDPLFGNPETTKVIAARIHPDALRDALVRYGLFDIAGIADPSTLTPAQLADFAANLPFAQMPDVFIGTKRMDDWNDAAKKFADSGVSKLYVISNLAKAVQYAMHEQRLAIDFTNQWGWKHHFATMEEAINEGWVGIDGLTQGKRSVNLARYLPKPEDGGLYPREQAEQFLSLNRWHNQLNNRQMRSPGFESSLRLIMGVTGFIKATFTIFRLGHHIGNVVGDSSSAIIFGAVNPINWAQAAKVAVMFMDEDLKATWGSNKFGNKFMKMLEDIPMDAKEKAAFTNSMKEGISEPTIIVTGKDGKNKGLKIPYEILFRYAKEKGVLSGNIYQNDIQGQYDELIQGMSKLDGPRRTLVERIGAKARSGTAAIERGPGAFASWYSNIPRMATFMRVISENRTWNSLEEALEAGHREVLRIHPNISSLAAGERRTTRLSFTFYSWIKVAHIAFMDMTLDHTAALLLFPKYQYNVAESEGLNPESFGDPWDPKAPGTPTRMSRSLYGPTAVVDGNVTGYGRNILPLDVPNFWNFVYDPAYTPEQNALTNWENLGRTLGQQFNPFLQGGMNFFDPSLTPELTGDVPALQAGASPLDVLLQKTGFYGAAQGAGAYTPGTPLYELRKQLGIAPVEALEIDEKEMARKARNWIWGQKEFVVGTPAMIKEQKAEETRRRKAWIEQQKGK